MERCKHGVANIDCFECYPSKNPAPSVAEGDEEIAETYCKSLHRETGATERIRMYSAVKFGIAKGREMERENGPTLCRFCEENPKAHAEIAALQEQVKELEGVLDLKQDEYVQQVGTWKIIQRLEEQVKQLTEGLSGLIFHIQKEYKGNEKELMTPQCYEAFAAALSAIEKSQGEKR